MYKGDEMVTIHGEKCFFIKEDVHHIAVVSDEKELYHPRPEIQWIEKGRVWKKENV